MLRACCANGECVRETVGTEKPNKAEVVNARPPNRHPNNANVPSGNGKVRVVCKPNEEYNR